MSATFTDSSTECAICLNSLDDGRTIVLTCGHRWHLDCLKEQLEHAQPNHARRLLFTGCRCAKCGVFCDHEALSDLTRKTDTLRTKVDKLVKEQLQIDAPQVLKHATDFTTHTMDEGRRNYAFYLCNSCQEPYFGGTAECADQEEGELPAEDRLCPTCQPQPNILCQDPVQHLGFHVWKCRYCCNPSEYVCYGTVHFCQPCHARNSRRVREGRGRGSGPPPLEAIACTGTCPFPKPKGQTLHANGSTPSCEQVYHCAWCLSSPSQQLYAFIQESGSRNFIVNSSGEQGFHGWTHSRQNGYQRWRVETSDIPVNASISTNFVSSYQWCVMMQEVPLHTFVRDPSTARIEVSTKIMGRTDCPSVFQMKAVVRDSRDRVLNRVQTGSVTTPADYWEKVSLIVEPVAGAHSIIMVVCGKDARYWGGYFGSKVTDCSVRILCPENELQNVLLPAGAVAERARVMPIPRIDAEQLRARFFDIWAPVLLILLVWLSSYS